tara:strand:+ start:397 stop:1257 length:861 start_codon:yes stop_codon:yes gene_type:complete
MAVPSSGQLSLLAIYNEIAENDYSSGTSRTNVSLEDLSDGTVNTINTSNDAADRPNGSAPHNMSEFYNYDHDLSAGTSFSSMYSAFLIETTTLNQTVFSGTKTFVINNGSGNVTITIGSIAPNTGTLSVAASGLGDPGINGTDNQGTGYITEGSTLTLTTSAMSGMSNPQTVTLKFKYVGHSSATSADQRTVSITNNGVTVSGENVSVATNAPKSDFRVKTNLNKIGHSPMGIPIYLFNYKDDLSTQYKGVVAQDLISMGITEPIGMRDGHYTVDYSKIDVDMEMI